MAQNLMIQGTMSGVGKSVVTAGLLRVLHQDGYCVAPFKSQNMALNSYITKAGLEMGRAQVMQAEAAGIEPDVRMNPILLKPDSDMGSQVILNGEVYGNYEAREYFAMKQGLLPLVMKAYQELAGEYDAILIEGAGSPAEINLKAHDIVNMGLAEAVDAPVLLVGDIDRGGVFAQLLGTLWLLTPQERARVKGLVINKFRGDKTLLTSGIKQLYEKGNVPIAGILPYAKLDLDEEDSLTERFSNRSRGVGISEQNQEEKTAGQIGMEEDCVVAAVVRFPHISNFTDFSLLESCKGVVLRYVESVQELGNPDIIILPGSKNTMSDLEWLKKTKMAEKIQEHALRKGRIIGICGGYQMLGRTISDNEKIESGDTAEGLGLLPVQTCLKNKKHRTRVSGNVQMLSGCYKALSKCAVKGYEIHMGETVTDATGGSASIQTFATLHDSVTHTVYADGCVSETVLGTYVHGVFDRAELLEGLLAPVFLEKGLQFEKPAYADNESYKQEQYDKLADIIREHMDMQLVYSLLGLK